ncbi:MAG TPA: hypothetical protein VN372_15850 [Methanospirillum sp.]|nr:hypothetical protein [Methanospirillum sp.]
MNRRYLIALILIIAALLVGVVAAKSVWSICDETLNPGCAESAKSQGYWNFQYDDAAPFTTAGMMCCWWERWYRWQKFTTLEEQEAVTADDEESVATKSYDPADSIKEVETKSFCPSCCTTCDDDKGGNAGLQARSDAMMAKKPWLTEGQKTEKTTEVTESPTQEPTSEATPAQMVMTFSDPK